ncbi:hypothetical protein AWQ21_09805 [Picosynechococcus sp. PCC 7003]|nr:hypothetical protein AWQ21_09805 [Picosynechococcus sp. PCC 7003]
MLNIVFAMVPEPQLPVVSEVVSPLAQGLEFSPTAEGKAAYQLGVEFHGMADFNQAIAAYQRAIATDPNFVDPYINLSLIYIGMGQLNDAEALLQTVLTLPDHPEEPASIHALAHYNLGIIYSRQGDSTQALSQVNQALAIAPNFDQAQTFYQQLQTTPE